MEFSIEAQGLTKRFKQLTAVDRVSLRIRPGEIFGFLGPNGSGKSTTIRMLCAILRPTEGTACVGGYDILENPESIKREIGYMSQQFGLYQELSVRENILFYAGLYLDSYRTARSRTEEILSHLGLADRRRDLARNLSGGWKQRLALATSLVHRPRILFLDEPTAGIDPVARREIWDFLYELAGQGVTLFVTTHYMEEAERCNTIGFIHQGRLVACGPPEELRQQPYEGVLLQLDGPDVRRAFELLRGSPGIRYMNFYGPHLNVLVSDGERGLPGLLERLRASHLRIEEPRVIRPSIEDVFVRLTADDGKATGDPGAPLGAESPGARGGGGEG